MKNRLFPLRLTALFACAGLLCSVLLCVPALAAEVTGLYEVTVTVASRESEQERLEGFGVAMREMLVKLTGRTDTLSNPQISRAIASPQSYVDFWVYRTQPGQNDAQAPQSEQIALHVTFFEPGIQRLLNDAGIPVWPQNRPETLLWVVIQDELGERFIAGTAGGGEILEQLRAAAARRGLPLLSPLLDFEDQRALNADQLWSFDAEAVRQASLRYQGESILAVRIFRPLSGEIIGKAVYMFRDRLLEFEVLESELLPFLDGSINLAAEELAGYYAILMSGIDNSTEVLLTVDGIEGVGDYAGLLQYIGGLAAVNAVQVLSVEGGTMQLQLRTGGQFPQLIESIALDRRMNPLGEVSRNNQQVFMHYQWSAR